MIGLVKGKLKEVQKALYREHGINSFTDEIKEPEIYVLDKCMCENDKFVVISLRELANDDMSEAYILAVAIVSELL